MYETALSRRPKGKYFFIQRELDKIKSIPSENKSNISDPCRHYRIDRISAAGYINKEISKFEFNVYVRIMRKYSII